ncbi:MAG: cyclodeaminase/cyclohydrolase family protein, partial [Thermoplasmata archaeon]|nr:cyclodeaminase/cyclohydrolase family protein [Thermoplasmata archaeon]
MAARTPTPGGGSAAAAAAAFGTALGEMVLAYSSPADAPDPELSALARDLQAERLELLELVDHDSLAYESVRTARKERKAHPNDPSAQKAWADALGQATDVPLRTARLAERVRRSLLAIRPRVKPAIVSDELPVRKLMTPF